MADLDLNAVTLARARVPQLLHDTTFSLSCVDQHGHELKRQESVYTPAAKL